MRNMYHVTSVRNKLQLLGLLLYILYILYILYYYINVKTEISSILFILMFTIVSNELLLCFYAEIFLTIYNFMFNNYSSSYR